MFRRETLNFLFLYADDLRHPRGVTINLWGEWREHGGVQSAIAALSVHPIE